MNVGGLLDKAIGVFAPQAALKRYRARVGHEVLRSYALGLHRRSYEGAVIDRRTQGWMTAATGVNAETGPALVRLRARTRDLVRNNAWASKATRVIVGNTVGAGILPQTKDDRAKELWKEWAESTQCDFDGVNTFYGIQALSLRIAVESGECLVRRINVRGASGLRVPLQLQVLEPDHIDLEKDTTLGGGGRIIQGVEFNRLGQRVAYWLFPEHPGETTMLRQESVRVPAAEILPVYRVDRPRQVHGVPWMSPCIIRARDYDEYLDAQLMRQKIAAMFVGFVHDIQSDGQTDGSNLEKDPVDLDPGTWEHLPPGRTVTFSDPPGVEGLGEYSRLTLREIAAGIGVTYEAITGDLSNVNFSSGRLGVLEFQRELTQTQRLILIPRLCMPVWNWFCFAAALNGEMGLDPVAVSWTIPRREQIDPKRETDARILRVRAGFTSLSEELRQDGIPDPMEMLDELASDMQAAREKELRLDTDGLAEVVSSPFDVETPGGIE